MQFAGWALLFTRRKGANGHRRAAGGHQHRGFTGFDPATHFVDRRFKRPLNEGLQERPPLRGHRIIPNKIPLESHSPHTGAGQGAGITTIGKDQFRGATADVEQKMRTVSKRHS